MAGKQTLKLQLFLASAQRDWSEAPPDSFGMVKEVLRVYEGYRLLGRYNLEEMADSQSSFLQQRSPLAT